MIDPQMGSARSHRWALLLLLAGACGDDEVTGEGGGGSASASTTTASSSSSTSTASSSSSATQGSASSASGGGGSGGGGGETSSSGGGGASACEALAGEGAAIVVVIVDEDGREVPAPRVAWQLAPADAFWLAPEEATCADGEPPCAVWEIATAPAGRITISAERETEAEPTESCFPYASTFVTVHPSAERQLVHLTLPTDGAYCIDPDSGMAVVNVEHDEMIDDADCLEAPPPVTGPIVLDVVDLDGEPVPGSMAHWYYPPKSPDFDGEHPLACADTRCTRWVAEEAPAAGPIYLNVTYAGPLNPFVQQGWSGYGAGPFEVEVDGSGRMIPIAATLEVDTTLEGAIGGDRPLP